MKLGIKPAAEAVGLTLQNRGRQVRQAFYGEEAQRVQWGGHDDVRVMVRDPRDESPLARRPGRGFASIRRADHNRAGNVTASVDPGVASAGDVIADLARACCPRSWPATRAYSTRSRGRWPSSTTRSAGCSAVSCSRC